MTDFPDLKLKALVSFPATVLDGTGIDVVKQNGNYQFNLDFGDFAPPVGAIPDAAHQSALLWNSISNSYVLAPVSLLGSGGPGGGIPEAPTDGVQYGRQAVAGTPSWTPVVGGTGAGGNTILYGTGNPALATGVDGDFYINTTTHFIFGPKAAGAWPSGTSMIGPPGTPGVDGNTVLYGSGAPTSGTGINGNFYINTATNFLYGPKSAGAWPAGISMVGPQGPPGTSGSGSGNVTGPASAINNNIATFNGTSGALIQDGGQSIANLATTASVATAIANAAVRYDLVQALTAPQQAQARSNLAIIQNPSDIVQNFKNIVGRNGGFEVWQRLVGGATSIPVAAGATVYTVDGWYVTAQQNETITQVPGLTPGSRYAAKVQRNSGQTGVGLDGLSFPLDTDEVNKLKGNTIVISLTAKAGANWSPAGGSFNCFLFAGTGGAPAKRGFNAYTGEVLISSTLVSVAAGATTRFVSAISAAVPTNINQAELFLDWTPVGTAGADDSITFDDVQIEAVPAGVTTVNPLFERMDYLWSLQRCQRFLPVYNAADASVRNFAFGSAIATSITYHAVPFTVTVRAAPTGITVSSPTHFAATNGIGTTTTLATLVFNTSSFNSCFVSTTVAGTPYTVGQGSALSSQNAAGQILFTGAEI